ncbi:MAG: dihydroxyacetone kinase subunit DhaL [SAR324 cluster bacterium]|nr:dihydroxyacetone kinase subunit DhaL [SAR324 cluster bacterium]
MEKLQMTPDLLRSLLQGTAEAVIAQSEHLTALDQAIGDGDHGINMKRGLENVLTDLDNIIAKPPAEALKSVGMTMVMKVGGASGPLYGTLVMTLGKEWPPDDELDSAKLSQMLAASLEALKKRGKADLGAKTMLDVLAPVRQALEANKSLAEISAIAQQAAEATIPMKATRGRASFLGDRSIGHMDPGACSSALMIQTICQLLEEKS